MQHKFYIYREKRGLGHPETAALVKKAAAAALRAEGVDEPCEIGVTLTNDEGIHAINREQRGVDRPTDVLSFPIDEMDYDTNRRYLGDMVLPARACRSAGRGVRRRSARGAVFTVPAASVTGYDHPWTRRKSQMRASK